jgi:hypothetical protein
MSASEEKLSSRGQKPIVRTAVFSNFPVDSVLRGY